jgi:hypothetical protein
MPTKTSALSEELKQTRPFHSTAHEALLSVLRTAAVVQRVTAQVVELSGITVQQYNVLRILRGAGDAGLPTLAIRDRMIEEAAGITRLLDKLLCQITPAGLALLAALDAPMEAMTESAFSTLNEAEKASLVELLGAVRVACRGVAAGGDQGSERGGQPPR